ncbi:response regulator transcription factor [Clostridium carnis]
MKKVMLVDDEKLILQGLSNIIEWEELGFNIVHMAEDGVEALELFKKEPVDVIVTDINMPRLTGLELLKSIKDENKDVKFIILSGYDEFSYAKKAIKLGVENYILKPINEEELEEALIKVRNDIDEERKNESKLLDRNRSLISFLEAKTIDYENKYIQSITKSNSEDMYYTVSVIVPSNKEIKIDKNINKILNIDLNIKYECVYKLDGSLVVINAFKNTYSRDEVLSYFKKVKELLAKEHEKEIFIGIGDSVKSIDELNLSYKSAVKLKKYILTDGYNVCLCSEKISSIKENNRNFAKEIENINSLIIEKNKEEIKKYISEIFDDYDLTPKNIYDLSIKIIILINKISEEFKIDKKYSNYGLSDTIVELCNESKRDNVKSFIISELEELISLMNAGVIKYSPVVSQIINCINERYYEELSLKTLAQQYNINSSYLGQIFTKEVGYSFSDYLNRVKNKKAKDLILNTNKRINDIAKEVGYIDTSYFYRKFKKYYGVCPSTLREMKNY